MAFLSQPMDFYPAEIEGLAIFCRANEGLSCRAPRDGRLSCCNSALAADADKREQLLEEALDFLQQALQQQQTIRSGEQPPHALAAVDEAITSQLKALQEEQRALKWSTHAQARLQALRRFNRTLAQRPKRAHAHARIFGRATGQPNGPLQTLRLPDGTITTNPREIPDIIHSYYQHEARAIEPQTGEFLPERMNASDPLPHADPAAPDHLCMPGPTHMRRHLL